jgi:GntR family transcriptional repressor for pyruvate dehydrogenase complex
VAERRISADFSPLRRAPRLSDELADVILKSIIQDNLRPGDPLPSQRELGEQFGVSRTVVREAVRSLAAKGVIDVRSGSGLRVAATDAASVRESMALFLRTMSPPALDKVWEVRKTLETLIVALAAERATADNVTELRRLCDRYGDALDNLATDGGLDTVARLDADFHHAIAEATQNELYVMILDAIADALNEIRRIAVRYGNPESATQALTFHREIVERIATHDPLGARNAMSEHLDEVERTWASVRATDSTRAPEIADRAAITEGWTSLRR